MITFEILDNAQVLIVEDLSRELDDGSLLPSIAKTHYGFVKEVREVFENQSRVFFHGLFNLKKGEYEIDPDNKDPIEVDGVLHDLGEDGKVYISNVERPEIPQPSNFEVAQLISDLDARLVIAGVIE